MWQATRQALAGLLVLCAVTAGCSDRVVLGSFLSALPADAGLDAGFDPDAGSTDAGSTDAGSTPDAGSTDAGPADAGLDAGGPDASVADLALAAPALLIAELDGGAQRLRVVVSNQGTAPAAAPTLLLRWPADLDFAFATGCGDAGSQSFDGGVEWTCPLPVLAPGGTAVTEVDLVAATQVKAAFIDLQASTSSAEASSADNTALSIFVTTPPSGPLLVFTPPAVFTLQECVGTNITSWTQCVPGSRVTFVLELFADGGFGEADGGAASSGFWSLGDGGFFILIPDPGIDFSALLGGSVDGACAEGVIQNGLGRPAAGAFRGCF